MRCYLVKGPGAQRYASTAADAREWKGQLADQLGCKKKDVTVEQVEVPVAKGPLLDYLNELVQQLDDEEDE